MLLRADVCVADARLQVTAELHDNKKLMTKDYRDKLYGTVKELAARDKKSR